MRRSTMLLLGWGALVCAVLLASNAWWLRHNELPDGFQNEYEHVYTLTEVYFRVRDNSLQDAWSSLWDGYYPPLTHVVGGVGLGLGGRSRVVPAMALSAFLILLLGSAGWLTARLRDPQTAAVAIGLLATYPSIFGNARRYEPNIALAAMVALAATVLILRGGLDRWSTAVGFGVLAGLGMLTDRVVFAVYLFPMVAVAAVRSRHMDIAHRRAALFRWMAAGAIATAICGYYYVRFLTSHIDEIVSQIGGEVDAAGEVVVGFSRWSPTGLLYYPISFFDSQMGAVLATVTAMGLALYWVAGRRELDPGRAALLDAWLVGGLLVITLVSKKQPFYAIPLLAPAAVCAAIGWRAIPDVRARAVLAAVSLVMGGHQLAFLTRGEGLWPAPGRWTWFAGVSPLPDRFLGNEYTQAAPPHDFGLRVDRMAELCAVESDKAPDFPITVVFGEAQGAYEGQLMPALRLELDTLLVEGLLMNGEAVMDQAHRASCFVFVTGSDQAWPTREIIRREWDDWSVGEPMKPLYEAMERMQLSATLLDLWETERDEWVHVYTLVPEPSD